MADVTLPQLGETVTEGKIVKWNKQVGDKVKSDDALADVETDKATMEVPSPVSGEIIEIVAKIGDELSNGDLVPKIRVSADASAAPPAVPASVPGPAKQRGTTAAHSPPAAA